MSHEKGSRRERELVNLLYLLGFQIIRTPASGSATSRELPDLIAGRNGLSYAVEAKSRSSDSFYIEGEEIDDLYQFARHFGCVPLVAVKFDLQYHDPAYGREGLSGWYVFHPDELPQTDGGNYRVTKQETLKRGIPIRLLSETQIPNRFTEYLPEYIKESRIMDEQEKALLRESKQSQAEG